VRQEELLINFDAGICRGHYAWRVIAYNILRAGFYWPTLFSQVGEKVRICTQCKLFAGKQKLAALHLVPVLVQTPFLQWGLNFIREIHPASSSQNRWILTAIDYFTKWVEAIQVRNEIDTVVIKFIEENILSRFGCPQKIVTDNSVVFSSVKMIEFCKKYQILVHHYTPIIHKEMDWKSLQTRAWLNSLRKHWKTTKVVGTTISYMWFGQSKYLQRGQQENLHFIFFMARKPYFLRIYLFLS